MFLFIILILIVAVLIGLTIAILFLLTLQNTLKAISPANRKMEPGMVWLSLIPFFNVVWQFIVVKKISGSIAAEYNSRNIPCPPKPTYNVGLAYCILTCLGLVLYSYTFLRIGVNLAGVVCFIIYWVQVHDYKKELQRMPPADYKDSEIFGNI